MELDPGGVGPPHAGELSRNGETDLSQNLRPSFLHWLLSNKLPLSFRFLICKVEIKIPASKIVRIKGIEVPCLAPGLHTQGKR